MKKGIHPTYYPEAKIIVNGEEVLVTGSTKPELRLEIWSGNHPFYTGEQRIIDTAGQVDRFMRRLQTSQSKQSEARKRREERGPSPEPAKKPSLYQQVFGEGEGAEDNNDEQSS